jgi:hypothetical protein
MLAAVAGGLQAAPALAMVAAWFVAWIYRDCSSATGAALQALERIKELD